MSIFSVPPLFVSANMDLLLLVNSEWGNVTFLAKDAESALKSQLLQTAPPGTILVLDAQVPQTSALPPDWQEKAARGMIENLRKNGVRIPVLVISLLTVGTGDLYDFCGPEVNAIALPFEHLNRKTGMAFIRMLEPRPPIPQPTWDVIEVEVKYDSAKCFLGSRGGTMIEWSQSRSRNRMAEKLAYEYTNPQFKPGWARTMHNHGAWLFNDLVISTLGRGFFAHLELAAGGLEKLAFRFRVDDRTLYPAPFEAAVRESGQRISGDDDDFDQDPFVLIHAPIARRMTTGVTLRAEPTTAAVPRPARLLFIRSQLCENTAGATDNDIVEVQETDRNDGRRRTKQVPLGKLDNIDGELSFLQALEAAHPTIFSVTVLDLSKRCGPPGAERLVLQTLGESNFDVVHFAGHSLTTTSSLTFLVLPSDRLGEADSMAMHTFAEGVAGANARLVYLSSCQGSSANTVANLGQQGIPHVLGFRWDVDDERAAEFARLFYGDLFGSESSVISSAFRAACSGVYKSEQFENSSPIWASPILASMSDNWMAQSVL